MVRRIRHASPGRETIVAAEQEREIAGGMEFFPLSASEAVKVLPARRVLRVCLLAGLLICLPGCGRHHPAPPATSAPAQAGAASPNEDRTATELGELTQLVRKCAAEQRRAPPSLDELVTKGYLDSVPPAPNGKRFAINKKLEVYLTDR
jgi:predicted small lipoprotein YifL